MREWKDWLIIGFMTTLIILWAIVLGIRISKMERDIYELQHPWQRQPNFKVEYMLAGPNNLEDVLPGDWK
jgi:hypothetical protein